MVQCLKSVYYPKRGRGFSSFLAGRVVLQRFVAAGLFADVVGLRVQSVVVGVCCLSLMV